MAIDQRYTKWVKKEGKRGYVVDTRTGKKVTGNVKLVADTTKGKAGEVQKYKAGVGRKVQAQAAGAGVKPGRPKAPTARPQGAATTNRPVPKTATPPAAKPTPKRPASAMSASEREKMSKGRPGWKSGARRPASYQAGAGTGSRRTTSPTVSGAVAAGKAAGPRDTRTPAEKAYDAAKSELAAWRKKKLVTPADIALERKKRRMVQETLARVKAQAAKKK